ncbi:hypothetical protein BDR26DRAFT_864197 [Obelidium mucronatum]|nr:hypothetical protein BDR26DRAFT_864197 [Obelidium mucronatum]
MTSEFDHHHRLERALRLAASSSPWKKTAPPKIPPSIPSANTATFASYSEGGGARRLALKTAPLLAEERERDAEFFPTRLITPSSTATSVKTKQSPSRARSRSNSTHRKSVLLIDPKEQVSNTLLEQHLADYYRRDRWEEEVERRLYQDKENDSDLLIPYSVYPPWWGHEEHVPSRSVGNTRRKGKSDKADKKIANEEGGLVLKASGSSFKRCGRTLLRRSEEQTRTVEKATETDQDTDREIGTSREITSGEETDDDADQDMSMERGRHNHKQWVRTEQPGISNWKFPKQKVDESIQVNFPPQSKSEASQTAVLDFRSSSRSNESSPEPPVLSSSFQKTKTSTAVDSPKRRDPQPPLLNKDHVKHKTPGSPQRGNGLSPPPHGNKFHHFTIPVHDLVPKKKRTKKKAIGDSGKSGNGTVPGGVGGMVGAGAAAQTRRTKEKKRDPSSNTEGEKKKADDQVPQQSVLDIVYAFLGDERVMGALDLNVLKDEE